MKLKLLVVVSIVMSASTNASAQGWWNILGPVRNQLGSQLRHASPVGYNVLLGINRSVPPQVKNGGGFGMVPYGIGGHGAPGYGIPYAGIGYQQQLAYVRSIPPQVKNEWAKQQRLASINPMPLQTFYAPNPSPVAPIVVAPIVINAGGGVITAPPPSNVIPNGP